MACPAGQWQDATGADTCQTCAAGQASSVEAATSNTCVDTAWTITSGEAFCHVVADPENLGRSCITDGGDQYGNNENCGFTLNVALEVVAVGAFDLET